MMNLKQAKAELWLDEHMDPNVRYDVEHLRQLCPHEIEYDDFRLMIRDSYCIWIDGMNDDEAYRPFRKGEKSIRMA